MTNDSQYDLPAGPAGTTIEMTIDGYVYLLQRIPIDNLPTFRARHNLHPVGPIGGQNTWPPAILYHPASPRPLGEGPGVRAKGDPHA